MYFKVIPLASIGLVLMAAVVLGVSIHSSNHALNPANVLSDDENYAQLLFGDENITCPNGLFKYRQSCSDQNYSNVLIKTGSDANSFYGWLIIDFSGDSNAIADVNTVEVILTDQNLDCTDCNNSVSVEVFTTADLDATTLSWQHRGTCTAPDDYGYVACNVSFAATEVEGVLIGRSLYPDSHPDPAVYVVKLYTQ